MFTFSTESFILLTFGIIILALLIWNIILEIRFRKFLKGKDGRNLEKTIITNLKNIEEIKKNQKEYEKAILLLANKFRKSIQGSGIVRFNPFQETGGKQSFAIALIDENEDGIIISSLYSRERMSIFAKEIEKGNSKHELSNEEKKSLNIAKEKLQKYEK